MGVFQNLCNRFFPPKIAPMRTIFFSETNDANLIGREIEMRHKRYIICEVVHVSWLKRRSVKTYIPLYAVRGRMLGGNGG